MKCVDTIARIRREFFVQGKTIKEIVRELHVSRNTVRKVVRSGATAFEYERDRQPRPRIGPWQAALDGILVSNETRAVRERLTLIRVFEELRGLGYEGGYDAVRRYARGWPREQVTSSAATPASSWGDWPRRASPRAGWVVRKVVAERQLEQDAAERADEEEKPEVTTPPGGDDGASPGDTAGSTATMKPTRFFGSVEIDPSRPIRSFSHDPGCASRH